jgi:transcription initiation factor TFIIE subunit alpha
LKDYSQYLEDMLEYIAGKEVIPLVNSLKSKENVSEFKLAEDLKGEVNYIRNLLYRLYDYNLVSFTRKKDKLKGWYIYYWTFNKDKILDVLIKIEKDKLERLRNRHAAENGGLFFCCQTKCVRLDFEHATDFEFRCPECGEIVLQDDNSAHLSKISEQIKLSEVKLKDFESDLSDEMQRRVRESHREERLQKEREKAEKLKKEAKVRKAQNEKRKEKILKKKMKMMKAAKKTSKSKSVSKPASKSKVPSKPKSHKKKKVSFINKLKKKLDAKKMFKHQNKPKKKK